MTCAQQFIKECVFWELYITGALTSTTVITLYLHFAGISGWELALKSLTVFSGVSCVIWSLWCIKKIKEVACWWESLHSRLDNTQQLLSETKHELQTIKQYQQNTTAV